MAIGDLLHQTPVTTPDPYTGCPVTRLTPPDHTSHHMYFYNRMVTSDSSRLLYCAEINGRRNLYLMELATGDAVQLTEGDALDDYGAMISADDKSVYYQQDRKVWKLDLATLQRTCLYAAPDGWDCGNWGMSDDNRYLVMTETRRDTLPDLTGKKDTTDLVLALPENEMGGVTLQLLTNVDGEFRSIQTLALGAGSYNGCAALHAGTGRDDAAYLVMDAWADGNAMVSDIILYDAESGSLQPYHPPGLSDPQRSTLRYHTELLSRDIDGNGTVDIPAEIDDGGDLQTPVDKRLVFLLWKDYANNSGGNSLFGVYDSKENFFMALPESMHGSIMIRGNQSGTGWLICNREGTVVYCEMRVVDLDEPESIEYERIANIGSQQLQARMVTSYYGLSMDYIKSNTVLLGTA